MESVLSIWLCNCRVPPGTSSSGRNLLCDGRAGNHWGCLRCTKEDPATREVWHHWQQIGRLLYMVLVSFYLLYGRLTKLSAACISSLATPPAIFWSTSLMMCLLQVCTMCPLSRDAYHVLQQCAEWGVARPDPTCDSSFSLLCS